MNYEFRIHKFLRLISILPFVILSCDLFFLFFTSVNSGMSHLLTKEGFIISILILPSMYLALSINKTRYNIVDGFIIVKDFLKKDTKHHISEILNIENIEIIRVLSYIQICFKNEKKVIVPMIENQDRFEEIITKMMSEAVKN
jgi:hypothetical protein